MLCWWSESQKRGKGLAQLPRQCGEARGLNGGSWLGFWSRTSWISCGLSRLFFLWPAHRRRVCDTSTAPELHPSRQFHSVLSSAIPRTPYPSPDTDSPLCRGSRGSSKPQDLSFSAARAAWGVLAARMVVNIGSSHVRVKDYVFATKGRI